MKRFVFVLLAVLVLVGLVTTPVQASGVVVSSQFTQIRNFDGSVTLVPNNAIFLNRGFGVRVDVGRPIVVDRAPIIVERRLFPLFRRTVIIGR